MRLILPILLWLAALPLAAQTIDLERIVQQHVLGGYNELARTAQSLQRAAQTDCSAENPALQQAYHDAFDAWIKVSHLRFGPSEQEDRAFALAFWPDPRGSTPKALAKLIRDEDQAVSDPAEFATVSIAARGFYALDFLLFDPQVAQTDNAAYHCVLVQAVTTDISLKADAIRDAWENGYAALMMTPGNDTYRTQLEAAQQAFTVLLTGLEFTAHTRLGRPMGTFDRPRPNRAEARRSGRSLRHVLLSLDATRELAGMISMGDEAVDKAFDNAIIRARNLDDPIFAGVANPQGRFRVEVLQQSIDAIRTLLAEEIGPSLGIAAGFNSLDGD